MSVYQLCIYINGCCRNGTQQELDERKILLEEIQGLVAGSKASIINFTVPSNEDFEGTNDVVMHPKAAKKARKEVDLDNREKDEILDSLGMTFNAF